MKTWGSLISSMIIAASSVFTVDAQANNCSPDMEPPTIEFAQQLIHAECQNNGAEITFDPNGDGSSVGDFVVSDLCQAIVSPTYDNGLGNGEGQPCVYPTDGSAATCNYPLELNGNAGLYVVTVSAADLSGNQSAVPVIIQVADTQPPIISYNENQTGVRECTSAQGLAVSEAAIDENFFLFQDTCLPEATITKSFTVCDPQGVCSTGLPTTGFFDFGETTITARAEDKYGNWAAKEVRIQVRDSVAPVVLPATSTGFSVTSAAEGSSLACSLVLDGQAISGTQVRLPKPAAIDACTEPGEIKYSWEGADGVFVETANPVVCLPNGETTQVIIRTRDQVGNVGAEQTLDINVGSDSSGYSINTEVAAGWSNSSLTLTAGFDESGTVPEPPVTWNGSLFEVVDEDDAEFSRTFGTDGVYCPVYVTATFNQGMDSASASSGCFGIDTNEPTHDFDRIQPHSRACEYLCVGGADAGESCLLDEDCDAGACEASFGPNAEISPDPSQPETLPIVFWGEKILMEFSAFDAEGVSQSGVKKVQVFLDPDDSDADAGKILEYDVPCETDEFGLEWCPTNYFVEGCNLDALGCTAVADEDGEFKNGRMSVSHLAPSVCSNDAEQACRFDADCGDGNTCDGLVHVLRVAVIDAAGNTTTTDTAFRLSNLNKGLAGANDTLSGKQDSILQWVSCLMDEASTPNAGRVLLGDARDLLRTAEVLTAESPGHAFLLASEAWNKINAASFARGLAVTPEQAIAEQLLRSVAGEVYTIYEKHYELTHDGDEDKPHSLLDWYPLRNCNARNEVNPEISCGGTIDGENCASSSLGAVCESGDVCEETNEPFSTETYLDRAFFFQNNAPQKTENRGGACTNIEESDYVIRVQDALKLSKSFLSQADAMEANGDGAKALEYYRTAFEGLVMLFNDSTYASIYERPFKPVGEICSPNAECTTYNIAEAYFRSSSPGRFGAPTAQTVVNQIERFYQEAQSGRLVGVPVEAIAKLQEIVVSINRFNESVAIIQENNWSFGICANDGSPCSFQNTDCGGQAQLCELQESRQCDGDTDADVRWAPCLSDLDCPNGTCGVPFNNERIVRDIYLNSQTALELMAQLPPQIIFTQYWRAALALTTAMVINFSMYEGATGIYPILNQGAGPDGLFSNSGLEPSTLNVAAQVAECRYSRLMWALTAGRLGDGFDEASIETAINLLLSSKCLIIKVYNENYLDDQGTGRFVGSDGFIDPAEYGCAAEIDVGTVADQCFCIGADNPSDNLTDTTCDGRDNDCDGVVDDDYASSSCGVGPCVSESACINGVELPCVPLLPAVTEDRSCDGVNNDCDPDNLVDEDWVPVSCGLGGCLNYSECRAFSACSAASSSPGTACDTDSDCGAQGLCLSAACSSGSSNPGDVCASDADCPSGSCIANAPEETACIPLEPALENEICNFQDDNCNILVDENLDDDHDGYGCAPGSAGCDRLSGGDPILCAGIVRVCSNDSSRACTQNADCGLTNTCLTIWQGHDDGVNWDCDDSDRNIFPGATEICNYRDDDCDGEIDEGVKNLCDNCDPNCRETNLGNGGEPFTDTGDNMVSTELDDDNQVTMQSAELDVEFAWVAVSGGGVVSKIDTTNGREVGRYCTALGTGATSVPSALEEPSYGRVRGVSNICQACGACNSGSRTTVDKESGSVFIANRAFGRQATLTKVLNIDYEEPLSMRGCVDLNENGRIDTSNDANGNGIIDQNDPAEYFGENDECVLWTKRPRYGEDGHDYDSELPQNGGGNDYFVARALALDADGDVWLGSWTGNGFWELNPDSGRIKRWVNMGIKPYGAVIDSQGVLWAPNDCCSTGQIRALNTSNQVVDLGSFSLAPGEVSGLKTQSWSAEERGNYGITVDDEDRVWLGSYSSNNWSAARYDPESNQWHKAVTSGNSAGMGRGVTSGLDRHTDRWVAWVAQHGGWTGGRITGFYTDTVCSDDHSQVCSSNSDCTGTCGLHIAGHDGVTYDKYIGWNVGPQGIRYGWIPVGIGIGKGAKIWTNNQSSENLTAYDPATGAVSYFPDDAIAPNGSVVNQGLRGWLYTYSDFTGNISASITDPQGSYNADIVACPDAVPLVRWDKLYWTAYYPGNSQLQVQLYGATALNGVEDNDNADGPSGDWTFLNTYSSGVGGLDCVDNFNGSRTCQVDIRSLPVDNSTNAYRYIRLRVIFTPNTDGNVNGQPQLDAMSFARTCRPAGE